MSIASEITRLQGAKADIIRAITNKGVTVPSSAKIDELAPLILSIIGGVTIGGRTYRTVVIGGKEWMAENLDYKFSHLAVGQSGTSTSSPRGNYYDNDESTYGVNGNKYGLLYNWIAVKYLEDNKSQLIPGWHVPTTAEWDALATAVGGTSVVGTKLKSTTDWQSGAGTDDYGFSALPAGNYNGRFYNLGILANFWTSVENGSSNAYSRYFDAGASMYSSSDNKNRQYSVRLVKDT